MAHLLTARTAQNTAQKSQRTSAVPTQPFSVRLGARIRFIILARPSAAAMAARLLALACVACLACSAGAQRSQSALFGELFGGTGTPAAAPPMARIPRAAPPGAPPRAPPAPRVGVASPEVGQLQFLSIDVHNDHKIVRSPLVTMDIVVEKAPPVLVEMPNVSKEDSEFACSRTGALLPPDCSVGDVRPGDAVSVRVLEAKGNVTLLPPRACRFFYEDLVANATNGGAPKIQKCFSADVNSVALQCRGCVAPSRPTLFATLQRVRLENALPKGRAVLACSAPSSGPFLLALPRVADAKVDYRCADTGASSCRLARIAPGERIACAVLDANRLSRPGAALLPASACRPSVDDLRVRPFDCQSAQARITLGCENC